jgi:cation diffusion facilitator CzcD-associated flavoprotein CzcO
MTIGSLRADAPRHVRVLIVGGGFSGLGLAIKLSQSGRRDYLVIERGSDVGGTWRDNTYPGAACDVPSQLYSYSFALNPNWTRSFSPQPEIQAYIKSVASKYGVLKNHLFDCELQSANWDAEAGHWAVETSRGNFTASVLVTAFGALCEPALPNIKGIETFTGEVMHSARWNHAVDLAGKRVAVIGTGASSIQIVPSIAPTVEQLDVYQRTAPWVMPRHDRAYTKAERRAFRIPGYQKVVRGLLYSSREITALGFCYEPRILAVAQKQAAANIRRSITDPALIKAVTPNFRMGCKRVLISNDYYPAIARDNVELVTDGIAEIRPGSIVTSDATVRPIDVLISATGFHVTDSPSAHLIKGADGRTLGAHWSEFGMQAYKGSTVAGFPNMFSIVGPNTGLGHTSMVYMIESSINYVMDALAVIDRNDLATVEVRQSAQDDYNIAVQKRMAKTIWTTGGCASWYLDEHGRNSTLWPDFTFKFRSMTRHFDLAAYRSTTRGDLAEQECR